MAGSWDHMVHDENCGEDSVCRGLVNHDGAPYRDRDGAFPLVENMGDAVEAMEECYGMVWHLAFALAQSNGTPTREEVLDVIEAARKNYREGYELGAGGPPSW